MTKKSKPTKSKGLVYKDSPPTVQAIEHVAGLVNPFSQQSRQQKIHDANSSKTFTFTSVTKVQIPTNAAGGGYAQFNPTLNTVAKWLKGDTLTNAGDGGNEINVSPDWGSSHITEYDDLVSSGARFRIVSWGIRLLSLENALDAKGQVLIREMDYNAVSGTEVDTYTDNYMMVPVTHNMDLAIIPNHVGESYQTFIPMDVQYNTLLTNNAIDPGYKSIHISLFGLTAGNGTPTSPPHLTAEIVMNLEILPLISSIGMRLATPPAPHSHAIMEAVHNTRTATPLVAKHQSIWSKIKSVASNVLSTGAQYLLGRAGGVLANYVNRVGTPYINRLTARATPLITN